MTKPQNIRPLDVIADDINKLERGNIFDIGDLLLEAKAQCEHGEWLSWLHAEFESYSVDTAERYMKVARLSAKFRSVRNLKLAATTLYELTDHDNGDDLQAIIKELAKHATKKRLKPLEAERVIGIGIGRRRFGDRPDATLLQLIELDPYSGETWYETAVSALQERNPETAEAANSIVDDVQAEHLAAEREAEKAEDDMDDDEVDDEAAEIERILGGPAPDLPPAAAPSQLQKFGDGTDWEGVGSFCGAVAALQWLLTKPAKRFVGQFTKAELHKVAEFLLAVAAAETKEAA
jgi:hypothetical protein